MIRTSLVLTSALALSLALAGCNKAKQGAETTGEAAQNAASTAANSAAGAAGSAGQAMSNAAENMGLKTPTATEFAEKAAMGGMFEIDSSKLAEQRSQNPEVKKFAALMIKDHTRLGDQLKAVVKKSGVTVTMPTALNPDMQAKLDALKNASAADFNTKYVDMQTSAHEDAVKMFQAYAKDGDNAELKTAAAAALPTLEKHLQEVKAIDKANLEKSAGAATPPVKKGY